MNIVLTTYPNDKPSGVAWLGEVPSHWEVLSLKRLGSFKSGAGFPVEHQGQEGEELPFFKVSDMNLPGNDKFMNSWNNSVSHSTATRLGAPIFPPGSIVFPKVGGAMLTNKRRVLTRPSCIDNNLMGCVVTRGNHVFVLLLLQNIDLALIAKPGPLPAISEGEIGEIRVTLPPLPEQRAIAYYLDHVDRRMRLYVTAKRKLIALLEEEKQAIVNQAVTRGLDPNVRLKPSGVEWLGYVPEHWQVSALRHRYRQCLGKMLDSKRITGRNSLPYLRNTDIQWDRINIEGLPTMDISPDEYSRYTVQQGDLLVCEGGEVGRCALWTSEETRFGFQKALHRLRPRNTRHDVPRFMYYTLRAAAKGNAFNDGHLSTIAHLTGDKLRAHRFPFPPLAEQESLVNFLDSVTKRIDQGISATLRQIDLLREYRTRLIADVVTGKLDVREAAAQLPDESDDEEPIDEGGALSDDADGDLYDAGNFKEELAMESEVSA